MHDFLQLFRCLTSWFLIFSESLFVAYGSKLIMALSRVLVAICLLVIHVDGQSTSGICEHGEDCPEKDKVAALEDQLQHVMGEIQQLQNSHHQLKQVRCWSILAQTARVNQTSFDQFITTNNSFYPWSYSCGFIIFCVFIRNWENGTRVNHLG